MLWNSSINFVFCKQQTMIISFLCTKLVKMFSIIASVKKKIGLLPLVVWSLPTLPYPDPAAPPPPRSLTYEPCFSSSEVASTLQPGRLVSLEVCTHSFFLQGMLFPLSLLILPHLLKFHLSGPKTHVLENDVLMFQ